MPTYLYQEILPDGSDGETFQYVQTMSEKPLKIHPKTGNPVRKIFHAPGLSGQYSERKMQAQLDNEHLQKHGFTRYEKDPLTGHYHKTSASEKKDSR